MKKGFPLILLFTAIVALSFTAFAGGETGYGSGRGKTVKNRSDFGHGARYMENLSRNDIKKMNEERDAFFLSTEKLRQDIYAKELELNAELGKKESDAEKALKLQKEISDLESKFDQMRINYMINMKKINPDLAIRFGRGELCIGGSCWE
jgi:Spy/CpxP family protein refolding chaperone